MADVRSEGACRSQRHATCSARVRAVEPRALLVPLGIGCRGLLQRRGGDCHRRERRGREWRPRRGRSAFLLAESDLVSRLRTRNGRLLRRGVPGFRVSASRRRLGRDREWHRRQIRQWRRRRDGRRGRSHGRHLPDGRPASWRSLHAGPHLLLRGLRRRRPHHRQLRDGQSGAEQQHLGAQHGRVRTGVLRIESPDLSGRAALRRGRGRRGDGKLRPQQLRHGSDIVWLLSVVLRRLRGGWISARRVHDQLQHLPAGRLPLTRLRRSRGAAPRPRRLTRFPLPGNWRTC
jgi:hypothetical protein